jgi:hypothetical protein
LYNRGISGLQERAGPQELLRRHDHRRVRHLLELRRPERAVWDAL